MRVVKSLEEVPKDGTHAIESWIYDDKLWSDTIRFANGRWEMYNSFEAYWDVRIPVPEYAHITEHCFILRETQNGVN